MPISSKNMVPVRSADVELKKMQERKKLFPCTFIKVFKDNIINRNL
jgi:hypothetical protein